MREPVGTGTVLVVRYLLRLGFFLEGWQAEGQKGNLAPPGRIGEPLGVEENGPTEQTGRVTTAKAKAK